MSSALTLLSSMAVKRLLADLMAMYRHTHADAAIELTSIGGVDAARRVAAGEPFDAVVLGADAIDRLSADGHVLAGSRIDPEAPPFSQAKDMLAEQTKQQRVQEEIIKLLREHGVEPLM